MNPRTVTAPACDLAGNVTKESSRFDLVLWKEGDRLESYRRSLTVTSTSAPAVGGTVIFFRWC